jgi:hypothetical protein
MAGLAVECGSAPRQLGHALHVALKMDVRWCLTITVFLVREPLFLSYSSALNFSDYPFLVHHPVNWDDWHLFAHAMSSYFEVTWHYEITV